MLKIIIFLILCSCVHYKNPTASTGTYINAASDELAKFRQKLCIGKVLYQWEHQVDSIVLQHICSQGSVTFLQCIPLPVKAIRNSVTVSSHTQTTSASQVWPILKKINLAPQTNLTLTEKRCFHGLGHLFLGMIPKWDLAHRPRMLFCSAH